MTVKELIEILSAFPDDLVVVDFTNDEIIAADQAVIDRYNPDTGKIDPEIVVRLD